MQAFLVGGSLERGGEVAAGLLPTAELLITIELLAAEWLGACMPEDLPHWLSHLLLLLIEVFSRVYCRGYPGS